MKICHNIENRHHCYTIYVPDDFINFITRIWDYEALYWMKQIIIECKVEYHLNQKAIHRCEMINKIYSEDRIYASRHMSVITKENDNHNITNRGCKMATDTGGSHIRYSNGPWLISAARQHHQQNRLPRHLDTRNAELTLADQLPICRQGFGAMD